MASEDTSASGNVVFQDGDSLSESNIAQAAAKSNQTDYVERGLGFANISSGSVTVGNGHVVIEDSNKAYDLFPDQTDVSLPESNGTNHIFAVHDPSVDDNISYHADTDDSAPSNPAVKIGTVDTSNTSSTTTNRAPNGDYESLSTEDLSIADDIQVATDSSELQSLLADGRTIMLLDDVYEIDTIDKACRIVGTNASDTSIVGSQLADSSGNGITVSAEAEVKNCRLNDNMEITASRVGVIDCAGFSSFTLTLTGSVFSDIRGNERFDVDIDNNSEKNVVTGNTDTTVTDNGTGNAVANNTS